MPGNFIKEDLRVAKTYKALQNAIVTLLKRRKFEQLTINDLCEEALISRAAFYMHFKDKYDLLKSWLDSLLKEFNSAHIEDFICRLAYEYSKVMQNIILDADDETLQLVHNFIRSLSYKFFMIDDDRKDNFKYMLLTTFCEGGIYEIVSSLIKRQNLQKSEPAKEYLHDLLQTLFDFHTKYIYK